ncbi:hypothetical protein ACFXNW_27965 [Nocardia sp. NPDC059180]|uniref:hypothetical protein n=1 Tax=Nocardia sp. NPDC059180 TaxID=3346761 RepID=UPI00367D7FD8
MVDLFMFALGIGVGAIVVWFGSLLLRPRHVDPGWSVRSIQARLEYEQTSRRTNGPKPIPLRDRRTA